MYPRLTVRSQDDPITEEEDSNSNITEEEDLNSNKSDERAIESLSSMAHEWLKSPVKQGKDTFLMLYLVFSYYLSLFPCLLIWYRSKVVCSLYQCITWLVPETGLVLVRRMYCFIYAVFLGFIKHKSGLH